MVYSTANFEADHVWFVENGLKCAEPLALQGLDITMISDWRGAKVLQDFISAGLSRLEQAETFLTTEKTQR